MNAVLRRRRRSKITIAVVGVMALALFAAFYHAPVRAVDRSVLVASTPHQRNVEREKDLKTVLAALQSYISEYGALPLKISKTAQEICNTTATPCKTAHLADLSFLYTKNSLLPALPTDPVGSHTRYGTGFTIRTDPATGHIVLAAIRAEEGETIAVQ